MFSVIFTQLFVLLTLILINIFEINAQNNLFLSNEDAQRRFQRDLLNVFLIQLKPNHHHHLQHADFMMPNINTYRPNHLKYNEANSLYNNAEDRRFINSYPQFAANAYQHYYGKPSFLTYGNNFLGNQNNKFSDYLVAKKKVTPLRKASGHDVKAGDKRSRLISEGNWYGNVLRPKQGEYYLPKQKTIILNKSSAYFLNQMPMISTLAPPIVKYYRSNTLSKPCQIIYNTIRYDYNCCAQFQKFTTSLQKCPQYALKCPLILTPNTSNVTQNFLGFNALISTENGQQASNAGNNNKKNHISKIISNESNQITNTSEMNQTAKMNGNNLKKSSIHKTSGGQSRRPFETILHNANRNYRNL